MSGKTLSTDQARTFYDRFGAKQDAQAFYEDPALDLLRANGDFASARHVLEFGCGTGRLAETLLDHDLPLSARYSGCDLSPVMVGLARDRMVRFDGRARVWQSNGPADFSPAGDDVDRIVVAYVLDVMPEAGIAGVLSASADALPPGGLLCTTCLTPGTNLPSRLTTAIWRGIFRLRPQIVGGCRPIRVTDWLDPSVWRVRFHDVVTPWAVPSEITVAERL